MNVLIFTPAPPGSTRGNRITAERWAGLLQSVGHAVAIVDPSTKVPFESLAAAPDVLIAIHATRSAAIVDEFRRTFPHQPIVLCLSGTDIHRDLAGQRDAAAQQAALAATRQANRLICLESESPKSLPAELRAKVNVVHQSARQANEPAAPSDGCFEICVIGHLRAVKDPFLAAEAVQLLPQTSRVQLLQAGDALDPELAEMARAESERNPRYQWSGSLSHDNSLRLISRCRLMVLTSRSESAPSVISEAVVAGTPLLATRIAGVCLLYTSPSPRDATLSRMPSSA